MRKNVIASLVFGFCLLFVAQTAIAEITINGDLSSEGAFQFYR